MDRRIRLEEGYSDMFPLEYIHRSEPPIVQVFLFSCQGNSHEACFSAGIAEGKD